MTQVSPQAWILALRPSSQLMRKPRGPIHPRALPHALRSASPHLQCQSLFPSSSTSPSIQSWALPTCSRSPKSRTERNGAYPDQSLTTAAHRCVPIAPSITRECGVSRSPQVAYARVAGNHFSNGNVLTDRQVTYVPRHGGKRTIGTSVWPSLREESLAA